jgi:hypothetical protein
VLEYARQIEAKYKSLLSRMSGTYLDGRVAIKLKDLPEPIYEAIKGVYGRNRVLDLGYIVRNTLTGTSEVILSEIKTGLTSDYGLRGGQPGYQARIDIAKLPELKALGAEHRAMANIFRIGGAAMTRLGLAYDIYKGLKTGDYSGLFGDALEGVAFMVDPRVGAATFAVRHVFAPTQLADSTEDTARRKRAAAIWGPVIVHVPPRSVPFNLRLPTDVRVLGDAKPRQDLLVPPLRIRGANSAFYADFE